MRLALLSLALSSGLLLSGCGATSDTADSSATEAATSQSAPASASPSSTAPSADTPSPTKQQPRPKRGTTIIVAASDYGPMLYDATGQPIYLFDAEKGSRPQCYGECAAAWPPVFAKGEPQAAKGVRAGLLGTTKRRDGRMQVTYDGHPLYFYAHEGKYDVRCHDVDQYGGLWLVVQPDGDPAPT